MKTKILTSGTDTEEACSISLTLFEKDKKIFCQGTDTLILNPLDNLQLIACGRNGTNGIIGRDGMHGINGFAGKDATKYFPGSDGGPGGNGGDGEPGTHGENGGNGGNVDIFVAEEDLALLDIIQKIKVDPGIPGKAGKHGRGGKAGLGGRGGASFPALSTDKSAIIHKGGNKGKDGSPGKSPEVILQAGLPGQAGKVHIHITNDEKIIATYIQTFHLKLKYLNYFSQENHGFWEPGDKISLIHQLKNHGLMPSPIEPISLILNQKPSISLIQNGEISGSIAFEQQQTSEAKPIQFTLIAPLEHKKSTPFHQEISLEVTAYNTRLQRSYRNCFSVMTMNLQYPIKYYETFSSKQKIQWDKPVRLATSIINISNKNLGEKAHRLIVIEVQSAHDLSIIKAKKVKHLGSGQVFNFSTNINVGIDKSYVDTRNFYINLYIQPIDKNLPLKLIQQQTRTIKFCHNYIPSSSKFLLIISDQTPIHQFKFWNENLTALAGCEVAVWNQSYKNKDFDLRKLLADTKQGTIIALDETFTLLSKKQVLEIIFEYDITLMQIGNNSIPKIISSQDNTIEWDETSAPTSLDKLIKTLLHEKTTKITQHQWVLSNITTDFNSSLGNSNHLIAHTHHLLKKIFPHRNYHVMITQQGADYVIIGIRRIASSERQDILFINALADYDETNLIRHLPFAQKLNLLTLTTVEKHSILLANIYKDLKKEQNLLRKAELYGDFWEIINATYVLDFNKELLNLNQFAYFLNMRSSDSVLDKKFHLLIIKLIAKLQYQADKHVTFWTSFKNWFYPQPIEKIREITESVCQKALQHESQIQNINKTIIEPYYKLYYLLNKLSTHAKKLEDPKAINAANEIVDTIHETLNNFVLQEKHCDKQYFNAKYKKIMQTNRSILENHRGILGIIDTILTIVAIMFIPIGSIFLYPAVREYQFQNNIQSTFFKTDTAKIIDEMDDCVHELVLVHQIN